MINSFRGQYYFLSNFYYAPVMYKGITYENNESAFQAQKAIDDGTRLQFYNLIPSEAKKLGRRIKLRTDWEDIKEQVMYEIVKEKFIQNLVIRQRLFDTGDEYLEEDNSWGDKIWGTVDGKGENKLGKILMRVREELKN